MLYYIDIIPLSRIGTINGNKYTSIFIKIIQMQK